MSMPCSVLREESVQDVDRAAPARQDVSVAARDQDVPQRVLEFFWSRVRLIVRLCDAEEAFVRGARGGEVFGDGFAADGVVGGDDRLAVFEACDDGRDEVGAEPAEQRLPVFVERGADEAREGAGLHVDAFPESVHVDLVLHESRAA